MEEYFKLERIVEPEKHPTYIILREQLRMENFKLKFEEIGWKNLPLTRRQFSDAGLVIFVDSDGAAKILKARHFSGGTVIPKGEYKIKL